MTPGAIIGTFPGLRGELQRAGPLQHLGAQVERPNDCVDEGEQEARQICAKHLPNEASKESEAGRTKFGVQVG